MAGEPANPQETLHYARDLGGLRRIGRSLRRRIEEQSRVSLDKVLIVQSDPMMRALLAATLSPETYDLLEAGSKQEAMALLRSERPSLVLLDGFLADGSGHDFCRQIKADPDLSDTLVVLLSGSPAQADREEALAAGADAHMPKPFSPLLLLKTIEELLC